MQILAVILLEEYAPIFMVLFLPRIQRLAIYHSINLEKLLRTRFTFVIERITLLFELFFISPWCEILFDVQSVLWACLTEIIFYLDFAKL